MRNAISAGLPAFFNNPWVLAVLIDFFMNLALINRCLPFFTVIYLNLKSKVL